MQKTSCLLGFVLFLAVMFLVCYENQKDFSNKNIENKLANKYSNNGIYDKKSGKKIEGMAGLVFSN